MNNIAVILFVNNTKVISQFEESPADIGDPDIVLIEPFEVKDTGEWFLGVDITSENRFEVNSDKFLTMVKPNTTLLEKYKTIIK